MPQNKKSKPPVAEMGGNIKPLKDDIIKARDRIIELKKERAGVNADIKAIMETMESKGIPKASLRDAIAYWEASPEQREGYHDAYAICIETFGMPFNAKQAEMFQDLNKKEKEAAAAAAAKNEPEQDDTDEDDDQFAVDRAKKAS